MKKVIRVTAKVFSYVIALLLLVIVILFSWLKYYSPGETEAIADDNEEIIEHSIAEIKTIKLNGIDQFVLIRGKSIDNPVLLMLHGGPGSPQAHMNCKYNKELEDHYIVVNWDQRGAGASYYDSINTDNMNIDIMIDDVKDLSEILKSRFNKDKIFILGHSWGSYLGMRTIQKHPDLFYAYIGIGQVADQLKSEEMSYNFVMNKAKEENNEKAIRQLTEIGYPENGIYNDVATAMKVERNWVNEYGGAAYGKNQKGMFGLFLMPLLKFKEYSISDKLNYIKGVVKTQETMWNTILEDKLEDMVTEVEVPIYILQGKHDYQTCFVLAEKYYNSISAPQKEFIVFENSAHLLPYNNEVDKFHDIMIKRVLAEGIK